MTRQRCGNCKAAAEASTPQSQVHVILTECAPNTHNSIDAATQATATFLAKADGTLSGLAVADMVFAAVDPSLVVEWQAQGELGL